jgi:hypothetical protein
MEELVKIFVGLVHKGMSRRIVMRFCGVLAGSIKEYRNLHKEFNLALLKQRYNSGATEPQIADEPMQAHESPKRGRKKKESSNETSEQHDNA